MEKGGGRVRERQKRGEEEKFISQVTYLSYDYIRFLYKGLQLGQHVWCNACLWKPTAYIFTTYMVISLSTTEIHCYIVRDR